MDGQSLSNAGTTENPYQNKSIGKRLELPSRLSQKDGINSKPTLSLVNLTIYLGVRRKTVNESHSLLLNKRNISQNSKLSCGSIKKMHLRNLSINRRKRLDKKFEELLTHTHKSALSTLDLSFKVYPGLSGSYNAAKGKLI